MVDKHAMNTFYAYITGQSPREDLEELLFQKILSGFDRDDTTLLRCAGYINQFKTNGRNRYKAYKSFTIEGVDLNPGDRFYWNYRKLQVTRGVHA